MKKMQALLIDFLQNECNRDAIEGALRVSLTAPSDAVVKAYAGGQPAGPSMTPPA